MANSWFSTALVSPSSPPALAGSLNRPQALPPDPPDPASPSDFPSLSSVRLVPFSKKSKLLLKSTSPKTKVPVVESFPPSLPIQPTAKVVTASQLLASYLSLPSTDLSMLRSGSESARSEIATASTVKSKKVEKLPEMSEASCSLPIAITTTQPQSGILGVAPNPLAKISDSTKPLQPTTSPDFVVISGYSPPLPLPRPSPPHTPHIHSPDFIPNPKPSSTAARPAAWTSKVKPVVDKSLKRLSDVTYSESGIPRVEIPDEVFRKGAELHKDFIVCRFFGRIPPYHLTQSVLNYMWGKGKHVEIHLSPAANSVLVRLPNEFIREKVIAKRIWYVGTTMFHVAQWSAEMDESTPSLQRIPLWAHLKNVPFDLIHQDGLSHIAGSIGEPKETDDWTINLTSISVAHVKVEVDASKPLPPVLEIIRSNGSVFSVNVEYPWVPPVCSHCKEVGHILRNCLHVPPAPPAPASNQAEPSVQSKTHVIPHTCYSCKEVGHFMRNCPKASDLWTLVTHKRKKKSLPDSQVKASSSSSQPSSACVLRPSETIVSSVVGVKQNSADMDKSANPAAVNDSVSDLISDQTHLLETMDTSPQKVTTANLGSPGSPDSFMEDVLCDCVMALPAQPNAHPIVVSNLPLSLPPSNKFDLFDPHISNPNSFNPFKPPKPLNPNLTSTNDLPFVTTTSATHSSPISPSTSTVLSLIPLLTQKENHPNPQ